MAGGTGGHIFPGLAVAEDLRRRGVDVSWLGAEGGMETRKVPGQGIALDTVRIAGLRGKGVAGWLALPFRLGRAVRDAGRVMKARRPACAVSFGGYVAGPGGLAAKLRGIPLVVHEQNRIPGMTNKALSRMARRVLQAFDGALAGAETVGNPVRAEVAALPAPDDRWAVREGPARLLVTGGSQGARALNELVPAALALLASRPGPGASAPAGDAMSLGSIPAVEVRHQAGERSVEDTLARYAEHGVAAEVTPFIEDMAGAYAWADLVVCRSGALTVSELAAAGLGAVLVPFPHAVDDHQTANARVLADAGAAHIAQEKDLDAAALAALLAPLLADRGETLRMARAARDVAVPDAAATVAEACMQWVTP